MRLWSTVAGLALGGGLLLGCGPPPGGSPEPEPGPDPGKPPPGFSWQAGPSCDEPTSGMARFTEEGALRGLVVAGELGQLGRSTLLAEDLDADGDIDLVYSVAAEDQPEHSTPMVLENDGSGFFSRPPIAALDVFQRPSPSTFLAADLDGDGLPELVLGSGSEVLVLDNLGGMDFGPVRSLFDPGKLMLSGADPAASGLAMKFTVGDADGDGDLDLAVLGGPPSLPPSEQGGEEAPAEAATPELLLLLEDGEVADSLLLLSPSGGTLSLGGTFTDRDGDGDLDLLVTSDLNLAGSFWRNDGLDAEGLPIFVDDAAAIGAALEIAAMGVDAADLNADGWLDYCITDTSSPACLLSSGEGDWYEGAAALGLDPAVPVGEGGTLGWGFDLADLDHDGLLDAVQASGRAGNLGAPEYDADYPDLLWRGRAGGSFEDATAEAGFGDESDNYGLVTADLDGDGWLEVVVLGSDRLPLLYRNSCGSAGWLDLELVGPPGNRQGFGARVELELGESNRIREVQSLRGLGQGPSRVHLALGLLPEAPRLRVTWPDGEVSEATGVPANHFVTVTHPSVAR